MTRHAEVNIQDGQLFSKQFDDIYHSRDDGIAESRYVFLGGNDLPNAWQNRAHYCIAETGFGAGLNFLVTAQTWLDDPNRSDTLDYFSIEGYPLKVDDLRKVQTQWNAFPEISKALISQYPSITSGCHTLSFANGKIQLHLIFADIKLALDSYPLKPDCWFLDGFSPAKNPEMWCKEIMHRIGQLAPHDTSFASFTAAGEVRRNLIEAGFTVKKRKGYGRKREMIYGHKTRVIEAQNLAKHAPWFSAPKTPETLKHATVIGAGIAGAQIAYHLALQGLQVRVIDSADEIATGASGNLAGVLAPRLTAIPSEGEAFYIAAFLYQLNQITALKKQGHNIHFLQHGLLEFAHNPGARARFEKLAKRQELPEELCSLMNAKASSLALGETSAYPANLIKTAGSLYPKSLCHALLIHPNIHLRLATKLESISHIKGKPSLHISGNKTLSTDALIIANGYQATQFAKEVRISAVRGQSTAAKLDANSRLTHALGHAGYVVTTPSNEEQLIFGASYLRDDDGTELRPEESQSNLATLQKHAPQLAAHLTDIRDSHAGIRATTTDRWPVVGALPDASFYRQEYADLAKGKQYQAYPAAQYNSGIYILSGLGSRGLTSAAYCANLLCHIIFGKTPPASTQTLASLHPARFLVRSLKRR